MTREAKIGMLTGLGVIVLIGVLLSEYLGGGAGGIGGARAMSPTGRMATLPLGAAYREEVTGAVGVPTIAQDNSGTAMAQGQPVSTPGMLPLAAGTPSMPELSKPMRVETPSLVGGGLGGPALNQPVSAIPAGRVQAEQPVMGNVPTLQGPENGAGSQAAYVPTSGQGGFKQASGSSADAAEPINGTEYVIAPGDSLAKISRKFYKSSKASDLARIVAANPATLKTEKTMLIAGKKLIIPTVAPAAKATPTRTAAAAPAKKAIVVIHPPGAAMSEKVAQADAPKLEPKKESSKVYVVQSGDTLEKIAKKVSPGNVAETVKKIMAANGIKDAKSLQVGAKLKISVM